MFVRKLLFVVGVMFHLALLTLRPATAQNYVFQTVDAPGRSYFDEIPINTFTWIGSTGLIAQQYYGPDTPVGYGHTAVREEGVWSIIDVPGSLFSGGTRPNAKGQIVLTYALADGVQHIAIWRSGNYTSLPDLPGYTLIANALNNRGTLTGVAFDADGGEHGFVGDGGSYTLFDHPLATPGTAPFSLNDAGVVVGIYDDPDGTIQGFRLDGNRFEKITAPGSVWTLVYSINNAGVIGGAYLDTDFIAHGFMLRNGTYTTVDYPGAWQTKIDCISDRGVISGGYIAVDGSVHGFVAMPVHGYK